MKPVKLFYLESCPYCQKAFAFINELKQEDSRYKDIEIEMIEESVHPELIQGHEYYYVPTFYIEASKVHEGAVQKEEVRQILEKALE